LSHEPVQTVGKRNSSVLVSGEDRRAIRGTLFLPGIPGMRESIGEGMNTPLEECAEGLDWFTLNKPGKTQRRLQVQD